jgi:hypothetical protein
VAVTENLPVDDEVPAAEDVPMAQGAGDATDAATSLDAWRLLRIVRVRRELKVLCLIALFAVPLWAMVTLVAESVLSRSSDTFWAIDATIGPGFLVILGVLAASFLALIVMGRIGRSGRTAARLAPTVGQAPDLEIVDGGSPARGLYGQLRRRGIVRASAVLMFLVFGIVTVATAWDALPAWRANHGHGGPIVTIGKDATIAYSTVSARGHRDYFLDTPYGTAIAEDYTPRDNQRWTVLASDAGNGKAYLVGGYDYVLVAGICLFGFAVCAGIVTHTVRAARAERAARAAIGGTLADSVAYLSAGNTLRLRIAGRKPTTVDLTMRPVGPRGAAAWLARRRQIAAVTTVAVIAAAGTLVGLWESGVLKPPVKQRDVTLAFLAPTVWGPDATIHYTDLDAYTAVLHDALSNGGAATTGTAVTASVIVSSHQTHDAAFIDLATIGSAPPADAVADMMAFQRDTAQKQTVTPVTGLPDGWQGLLLVDKTSALYEFDFAAASAGLIVSVSVDGAYTDDAAVHTDDARALARAIAAQGIPRFAAAVAR